MLICLHPPLTPKYSSKQTNKQENKTGSAQHLIVHQFCFFFFTNVLWACSASVLCKFQAYNLLAILGNQKKTQINNYSCGSKSLLFGHKGYCTYIFTVLGNVIPLLLGLFLITLSSGLHRYTLLSLYSSTGRACCTWRCRWIALFICSILCGATCTACSSGKRIDEGASRARPARANRTWTFKSIKNLLIRYSNSKHSVEIIMADFDPFMYRYIFSSPFSTRFLWLQVGRIKTSRQSIFGDHFLYSQNCMFDIVVIL